MAKAADYLLELNKQDFRILQAIEVGMRTSEYVSSESIFELSKLSPDIVINRLDELHYKELIFRWKGSFLGYQLTHHGYDVLAFHALAERDSIVAIGRELGKGKESDVFLAFNENQEELVAKIHRVGRPSFQRSKKLRGYVGKRGHINWLYKSRLSAEREFEGLTIATKIGSKTPRAIDINRHIIIMEFFEGTELVNMISLKNPLRIFNGIISEIRKLFVKGEIIHGDLSEYNVIITPKEDFLLIDFPQYESAQHVNSQELLQRDIFNICKYFKRKFKIQSDPQAIFDVIIEEYQNKK
ncbi:MAG: serine/threonine protein kinase [Asgard group archaeon]|nr:serine/threonine protein kinase [Asgard group archaeon]